MNIFFILFSAGIGSRLNTSFPKPLSPILKSTPLDYNLKSIIKLCEIANLKNFIIYINLHKSADKIYKHVVENYSWLIKKEKLKFLFEHTPLGHIGTINKLKYGILRYNKLITLNADSIIPNLEQIILPILNYPYSYILLYKMNIKFLDNFNKKESNLKTLTHFQIKKIANFYKVEGFTKNLESLQTLNLYTGISLINLNRDISLILLENNFKNLSFLEFLKILISQNLFATFTPEFYEITNSKDLLEINVKFLINSTLGYLTNRSM